MIGSGRVAAGLIAAGLVSAACGGAEPSRVADLFTTANDTTAADRVIGAMRTVNVYVSEAGYDPREVRVRVGEAIELVLRNIGNDEHHYKALAMPARDIFWLDQSVVDYGATAADVRPEPAGQHDHEHGIGGLVPMRASESRSGIQRRGDEVHAWSYGGKMDVIVFTPTKAGTYTVTDPLHPQIVGRVIVDK